MIDIPWVLPISAAAFVALLAFWLERRGESLIKLRDENDRLRRYIELADEDHEIIERHNLDRAEAAEAHVRELENEIERLRAGM